MASSPRTLSVGDSRFSLEVHRGVAIDDAPIRSGEGVVVAEGTIVVEHTTVDGQIGVGGGRPIVGHRSGDVDVGGCVQRALNRGAVGVGELEGVELASAGAAAADAQGLWAAAVQNEAGPDGVETVVRGGTGQGEVAADSNCTGVHRRGRAAGVHVVDTAEGRVSGDGDASGTVA
jgi:hypothetical protein